MATKKPINKTVGDGEVTGVSTPVEVWDAMNMALHEKCLYPTIRVKEARATGSGTIIYCQERTEKDEDGEYGYSTYALTNHHVVTARSGSRRSLTRSAARRSPGTTVS